MKNHFTMKKYTMIALLCWAFTGCGDDSQAELGRLKGELGEAKALIEKLQAEASKDGGKLVHIVYLKLKPEASIEEVVEEIEKIGSIEQVHGLEIGTFEDLEDPRALSEYQVIFQMSFDSKEDYATYQAHPTHLGLKGNLKSVLAAPPATYDYLKK